MIEPFLPTGYNIPNNYNDQTFIVGKDLFSNLMIQTKSDTNSFYYFFENDRNKLIKYFILEQRDEVDYICKVTLIKKENDFTPRMAFSVRDKKRNIKKEILGKSSFTPLMTIKANVDLAQCHENFWKLISFLQKFREIVVPKEVFSLVNENELEIINALRGRDIKSIINIIKELSLVEGVQLSDKEVNRILRRKEKLIEFRNKIAEKTSSEDWWQNFFEQNKWIFGYGLNYQILRTEQAQPHYGGMGVEGKGHHKGDFLLSTSGDLNFTVLVEIKTPETDLLRGTTEIRSGAWGLSKDLVDAVSQLQANIDMWNKQGSQQPDNIIKYEIENIFTIQPKGIILIGSLSQLNTKNKRETFERFRKSLHGVDILTFDELLKRAKFIIEEKFESE